MIASLTLVLGLLALTGPAEPTPQAADRSALPYLHPLFTEHGIVQRDVPVPIWGWCEPGQRVRASMANQWVETTADANGRWLVRLGPFPAGGPHTLKVTGPKEVEVADILVGDVWICSGQSNMEWPVGASLRSEQEVAAANQPRIRLFSLPHRLANVPQATVDAHWDVCTPGTVADFSAVGYFFGREIEREVGVPVGLIDSSWGGTIAEAWVAGDSLRRLGDFDKPLDEIEALGRLRQEDTQLAQSFERKLAAWWQENDPGARATPPWSAAEADTSTWKMMELPGHWESKGLADFDGVAWFRRDVFLPESWAGKPVTLHLGPIDDFDSTFLNGVAVGHKEAWNVDRVYQVPAGVVKAGRNVLAVRVFDKEGLGGFDAKPKEFRITRTDDDTIEPISLTGAWSYQVAAKASEMATPPEPSRSNPNRVTVLYNGMIAPLEPFAIRGALWYQGEANVGRGPQYQRLLPELIRDWRGHFGVGDFPFYIVQLANFQKRRDQPTNSAWAELREAQAIVARAVPHSGIALAIDIGDADDIHPRNKQEVGRRLALNALAQVYGKSVEFAGPTFRSMEVHEHSIRLSFDHAEGLKTSDGGPLKGFAIAGKDGRFEWADAVVDGTGVVVSSTEINQPILVRYAWADNPACNLVNGVGLPAVPFRTDTPKTDR